jgi:menaquinone-dependent protoporphyrinogen IX oxidase
MASRLSSGAGLSALAALIAGHAVARRIGRTWGATWQEAARPVPGDELVSEADSQVTMAVSIDAPPEAVWPWLVQMGVDRAGLYTHTWLENGLLRLGVRNAEVIRPEWQDLEVGDHIWFIPEGYPTPRFGPRVAALEPNRHLVCTLGEDASTPIGTWQFLLEPEGESTRLLFRSRASTSRRVGTKVLDLLLEPGYLYMDIGMLQGIADRAGAEPHVLPSVTLPPSQSTGATPPTVLVAVTSAQGATRQIAWFIAAELRRHGIMSEVRDAAAVEDLSGFDAVVLGSAIHTHQWLPDAQRFVERHRDALLERPVWLFSSGMLAIDTGEPWAAKYPEGITHVLASTGARGHRIFAGRRSLPEPKAFWKLLGQGFVWYAVMKGIAPRGYHMEFGDYRDWTEIRHWAAEIATASDTVTSGNVIGGQSDTQ